MYNIVLAVHIIFAIAMIGLILIQHGKGADAGASFGAGASGTVFGAAGSANFLSRATGILAGLFFVTSLTLAAFARKEAADQLRLDVVDTVPVTAPMTHTPPATPAVTAPTATAEPAVSGDVANGATPSTPVGNVPTVQANENVAQPQSVQNADTAVGNVVEQATNQTAEQTDNANLPSESDKLADTTTNKK